MIKYAASQSLTEDLSSYSDYFSNSFLFVSVFPYICLSFINRQMRCYFGFNDPLRQYFSLYRVVPGRVAQSVGHLTHKSGVLGFIPGLATYFRFSFRFFKKGSCQLLAKVCA